MTMSRSTGFARQSDTVGNTEQRVYFRRSGRSYSSGSQWSEPEEFPVPDGPILGSDLEKHDGLWTLLSKLRPQDVALILGQDDRPLP